MSVNANIKDIVRNIGKNTKFLQPLFEAISNSLEAGATNINITFSNELNLFGEPLINGFVIEDNGEGFNEKNIDAFNTLWTDNKRTIGCKGSGRFTWLKIYSDIVVVSILKNDKTKITIPFSINYDGDVKKEAINEDCENLTKITFSNVNADYEKAKESSNPRKVKNKIIDYLLIKFFLMKKDKCPFHISINNNIGEESTIGWEDIPDIQKKTFSLYADLIDKTYDFDLYYLFDQDAKNSKKMYFCSNYRSTKEIDSDSLGFSSSLPNKDSFIMFLCSSYFDGNDNDSRNDFEFLSNVKCPNFITPLLVKDIVAEAKKQMKMIIIELYPEIPTLNEIEVSKAINEVPYLANYIKKDNEIVKSCSSLITSAKKQFEKDKEKVKSDFLASLENKNIKTDDFSDAVNRISSIAAAELGEYVVYRDTIIKALKEAIIDEKTKESLIHNLFMPMKTTSHKGDASKHLLSNLWLIDDKFMTYSFVASDKSFEAISKELTEKDYCGLGKLNRPDTAVIFNKDNGRKDAIVIEYKGPNANIDEKSKSLTELPNNVNYLRNSVENIGVVWSYIFTSFDDVFENTLINQDYMPLFSTQENGKTFYKYLKNVNTHVYVMDYDALTENAESRNKTFMDLLKNNVEGK